MIDSIGRTYPATAAAPGAATVGEGAAGSADGAYKFYITYLITWPNGQQYETGLGTGSSSIAVSSKIIALTSIPVMTYIEVRTSAAPTIHRKIYVGPGTGGTLGDIYYVATISDNSTTTYNYDQTDATTILNNASLVDVLLPPPTLIKYFKYHYSRVFWLSATEPQRLQWSEAPTGNTGDENEDLFPMGRLTDNWDDLRSAGFGEISVTNPPMGIAVLGTSIYIPLRHTWIKKDGNTPSTWVYKKTMAFTGTSSPWTIQNIDRLNGIICLSSPRGKKCALTLFNGWTTLLITPERFNDIFEDGMSFSKAHLLLAQGFYDGRNYHLLYVSSGGSAVDSHAVFDLSQYPKIRLAYWGDLSGRCGSVHEQSTGVYIGGSDGFVRYNSGTATTTTPAIKTHDLIGGDPKLANTRKRLQRLYYNLSGTLTLKVFIDDVQVTWADATTSKTITGTGDKIQFQDMPQNCKCYKYYIDLSGSVTALTIFSPWEMKYEPVEQ